MTETAINGVATFTGFIPEETHAQMIERMLGEEVLSDGLGWLCPKCLIGELNEGPIWSYSCPKCVFFCDFDGLIEAIQIFNCEDMD